MNCKENKIISTILVIRGIFFLISFFTFAGFVFTYVRDSMIQGKSGYSLMPIGVSLIVFVAILFLPKLFGCALFEETDDKQPMPTKYRKTYMKNFFAVFSGVFIAHLLMLIIFSRKGADTLLDGLQIYLLPPVITGLIVGGIFVFINKRKSEGE